MSDLPDDPIGASWLAQTYQLLPTGRMPLQSQIGGRRATQISDGHRLETYPESMRPAAAPAAHLQFHLRHEVPHLEFLSRPFARTGPDFVDGNGRVHRFLINDILRRDGAVPDPVILPVSAVITDDSGERRNYDRVLDEVSKPLMQEAREHITFTSRQTIYPDGVVSNLEFSGNEQLRPVWRYSDLSPHVVYLSNIIKRTLTEQMREQSRYLRNHMRARHVLKEIIEMPDHQADRVLRSIEQNRSELSNVLLKQMPALGEPGVWIEIIEAVSQIFREDTPADTHVLDSG